MRSPTNVNALEFLLSKGVQINTILDVGAAKDTWHLQKVFPDKKHILFEPMVEFKNVCKKNYEDKDIDYELHNVALSNIIDPDGQMFYNKNTRKAGSYIWSGIIPKGVERYHGDEHPKRDMKIDTLDNFLADKKYKKPYYLKVDVDGGEMEVLEGASNILTDCSVIQVEACLDCSMKQELVWSKLDWFYDHGFQLWDIIDLLYKDDKLSQVDLIFLNVEDCNNIKTTMNSKGINFTHTWFTETGRL